MGVHSHPTTPPSPPAAISRILSRFTRTELEGFVAVAIDLMDVADGDPDLEDGGDREQDDDEGPAWMERADQTSSAYPFPDCVADHRNSEDAEDDDPDKGVDDDGEAIDEREPEHDIIPDYRTDQSTGPIMTYS